MQNLVSVIIPVYNRQDTIYECVQSVLEQSHQNYEIVLIDDGSTDRTLEMCRSLSSQDPRIILLETKHAGVSAARNEGLAAAKGEYVFFLDSDDVIHPLLLEDLIHGMQGSDATIAGSGVLNVSQLHWHKVYERIAQDSEPGETTYQNHEETLQAVFHVTTPINLIGGVMMRRDLIGKTRFRTDLFIGEDFYFVYENLVKGASTIFLKQKRYYGRIHDNNSSWDYGYSGFWTRFYRRKLVWENEDRLGRTEYANCQKQQGLAVYLQCLRHNDPNSEDSKKMRQAIKEHRSVLWPALSPKGKVRFALSVYAPSCYLAAFQVKQKLRNMLHIRK